MPPSNQRNYVTRKDLPETEGKAFWRENKTPADTLQARKDAELKNVDLVAISQTSNTHIILPAYTKTFQLYGTKDNVAKAKAILLSHVQQHNPTFKHRSNQYGPPADASFESMGSFAWPSSECPSPKKLGQFNFEELNDIRRSCKCHISFDADKSSFIVKGSIKGVQDAILRIRGALCGLVANDISTQRMHLHLNDCQQVQIKRYAHPVVLKLGQPKELAMGNAFTCLNAQLSPARNEATAQQVKKSVMQTLNKVRWYKGSIDMKAHLGVLTLQNFDNSRFNGGKCNLSDYEDMTKEPNFEARITEELGDKALEQHVLNRMKKADDLLSPVDYMIATLSEIKPVFIASVVIGSKSGQDGGDLQIIKEWEQQGEHRFNEQPPVYHRLSNQSRRKVFSEICVSDLVTDLTWQLDISASDVEDAEKLPEFETDLGNYFIRLLELQAKARSFPFCEFEKTWAGGGRPVLLKKSFKQKMVWRFELNEPHRGYLIEVAQVQNTIYSKGNVAGTEPVTVYEPRWTVEVVHDEWKKKFADNATLDVGKSAYWQPDMKTWFPTSSEDIDDKMNGHRELLQVLQIVQDIVRGQRQVNVNT